MSLNGSAPVISLDSATLRVLDTLANQWGVSRDLAAKRAIEQASPRTVGLDAAAKIETLRQLQKKLNLTPDQAAEWKRAVHENRR